jgi:hypothetical protein
VVSALISSLQILGSNTSESKPQPFSLSFSGSDPAPLLGLGPNPPTAVHRRRAAFSIRRLRSGQIQPAQFFFSLYSKIPANMQILVNSYLLNRNSEYKVFYMNFYQKNV